MIETSRPARGMLAVTAAALAAMLLTGGLGGAAATATPLLPVTDTAQAGSTQELQALFNAAQAGDTVDLRQRSFAIDTGSTIELPQAPSVTVDATGASFTIAGSPRKSVTFLSLMGDGLTWTGGTFTSDGVARLGFGMIQSTNSTFTGMTFVRAQGFSHHVFDLMANDGAVIDGVTFQGYGNQMSLDGLTPHNRYAEAVQIDASTEVSSGSPVQNRMLLERGGQFKAEMSRNVTVRNSRFEPAYDENGTMIAWGPQPFGQHAHLANSQNENIVFENNTVIDPIPAEGERYEAPLHFPPIKNLTIQGNEFRASVRQPAWIQLYNGTTTGPNTIGVTITDNSFQGVRPARAFVSLDVGQWNQAGYQRAISGVTIIENVFAAGGTPITAARGAVNLIAPPKEARNLVEGGAEQLPDRQLRPPAPAPTGTADFNSDGHADLVSIDKQGRLWLYPGDGLGRLKPRVLMRSSGWKGLQIVTVPDVTGDQKSDLLATGKDGKLWIYLGNGRGKLGNRILITGGFPSFRDLTSPGDLTGDGVSDLVGVNKRTGELKLWGLSRKGKIIKRSIIGTGWAGYDTSSISSMTAGGPVSIIGTRRSTGELWLYPWDGNKLGPRKLLGSSGWSPYQAVSAGDWTGDGRADLLAHDTRNGFLWLYPTGADGKTGLRTQIGTGWYSMTAIG